MFYSDECYYFIAFFTVIYLILTILLKKSCKQVNKRKPRIGERSKPNILGISPRNTNKYGSVIFFKLKKGCV